jgi:hypothetical protein
MNILFKCAGAIALVLGGNGCQPRQDVEARVRATVVNHTNRQNGTVNTSIVFDDGTHVSVFHSGGSALSSIAIRIGSSGKSGEIILFTNDNGVVRSTTDLERIEFLQAQNYWTDYFEELGKMKSTK